MAKIILEGDALGQLEDMLMELPAKYANPIINYLANIRRSQTTPTIPLPTVTTQPLVAVSKKPTKTKKHGIRKRRSQ